MKILYLSCHEVLEYDELRLFQDLGYEFFSCGAYVNPLSPGGNNMRLPLKQSLYPVLKDNFHEMMKLNNHSSSLAISKDKLLTKEFVDKFDVIIIMHVPEFIELNWEVMKHKPVIWRSIGQSTKHVENRISKFRNQGLKIVRYSPMESVIPDYCGENRIIRFGKYDSDFPNWKGNNKRVITIGQSMKSRGDFCGYSIFREVTEGFPRILFGPNNKNADMENRFLSNYLDLILELSDNRVYFYTGTKPASYTLNFIEAMMAGIPIVAIGKDYCKFEGFCAYEVDSILEDVGMCSNDKKVLADWILNCMSDYYVASEYSVKSREKANKLFGSDIIKSQWKEYLETL